MIIIKEDYNLLTDEEEILLKEKCENFTLSENPNDGTDQKNVKNFYNRNCFGFNDILYNKLCDKIEEHTKKIFLENNIKLYKIRIGETICINKIDCNSNKDDNFHYDQSDLTLILYINDNFDGGEFEYYNEENKKVKIKPKKNLIILSNNNLLHRVLPVTNGVRYSLVCFFRLVNKKEKTLI